ncbi:TolB family protein [Brevibacillus sp. 179-C9.3 HS]|uniref:TolB family protein n=1 Tax=unclassified Brevibacillus TaxID=2684853 RepID=UPI0039A1237D
MKKRFLLSCLLITMLGILIPGQINATAPAKADARKPEPVVIYKVGVDGKTTKTVTNMPLMHRATMSPSGRFIYGERIGYGKADPTIPYLYDMQTKKLTQLSGFAKWSPKQDALYIREKGGIAKLSLPDGKKIVLVQPVAQHPILDFSVSPDEQYMVFTRMNAKIAASDEVVNADLILQHLPTLKMKKNDQYAFNLNQYGPEEKYYWMPNSLKVFYKSYTGYKELDLPTGLKYDHKMQDFPSYSSDMKYRKMKSETAEYLLELQTGKKVVMSEYQESYPYLGDISWSPVGHHFAAEVPYRTSNSQQAYMLLRFCKQAQKCSYPLGNPDKPNISPYLSASDNIRVIGWAQDGKSYYVADLASTHFSEFALDKLGIHNNVYEQR